MHIDGNLIAQDVEQFTTKHVFYDNVNMNYRYQYNVITNNNESLQKYIYIYSFYHFVSSKITHD